MSTWRQINALIDVQIRSLWNSFHDGSGNGGLKASLSLAVAWYGLWIATAIGCASLPRMVGVPDVESILPGVFLFILCYWQLAPLLTLSLGVSIDVRKLTPYPVSMLSLFAVECLLRLGTGIEMVLVLAGFLAGLAWSGSEHTAGLAIAFAVFVAFNVFLSAGVRNLVERVFHQRRLRELLLILLVCATVLPQVLFWSEKARAGARAARELFRGFPLWALPSDIAARLASEPLELNRIVLLLLMTAVAGLFGYGQFRQGYRLAAAPAYPSSAGVTATRGRNGLLSVLSRLPSLLVPDPIGGLAEKEIKYLWRSPRFRLPFFMGFTFGVLAWVPILHQWRESWGGWLGQSAVTLVSLYAFLLLGPVMFLNRFGFDRHATRFYFWLPIGMKRLLLAKNLATVAFAVFEVALVALVCRLVGLPVGLPQLAEAAFCGGTALLYLLSVGNYMSVRFPAASNPDRISRSGPGHGLRATVQFLLFPAALLPLAGAFWLRYALQSPALFGTLLLAVGLLGAVVYFVSLSWLARDAEENRETLLAHLGQGEGPIATE